VPRAFTPRCAVPLLAMLLWRLGTHGSPAAYHRTRSRGW
jgi:hypothetical protein